MVINIDLIATEQLILYRLWIKRSAILTNLYTLKYIWQIWQMKVKVMGCKWYWLGYIKYVAYLFKNIL